MFSGLYINDIRVGLVLPHVVCVLGMIWCGGGGEGGVLVNSLTVRFVDRKKCFCMQVVQ